MKTFFLFYKMFIYTKPTFTACTKLIFFHGSKIYFYKKFKIKKNIINFI